MSGQSIEVNLQALTQYDKAADVHGEGFDGVVQTDIAVPREALREALAALDPLVRAGLEESIRRLRLTCEAELGTDPADPDSDDDGLSDGTEVNTTLTDPTDAGKPRTSTIATRSAHAVSSSRPKVQST